MYDYDPYYYDDDYAPYVPQTIERECKHEWKPILLLTNTVWDCRLCGKKKEEWEKEHG